MYLNTFDKIECYSCFACKDICPVNAIESKPGKDTYLYPEKDNTKCIDCGLCEKVCPYKTTDYFNKIKECYVGISKDDSVYFNSSSGGAFKSIVLSIIDLKYDKFKKFYICGCLFDNFNSVHRVVEFKNESSVNAFMKSKYVHSYCGEIYSQIKELISDCNNYLIFSGTPCQVLALKKYLGNYEFDNIFTIDILCKGGISQLTFDKYCQELEKENDSKLSSYQFKNKEMLDNGTVYSRSAKYVFENGVSKKVTHLNDPFLKLFYEDCTHIKSACLDCNLSRIERVGDMTIGDAWNVDSIYPDLNPFKGVSFFSFNTDESMCVKNTLYNYMNIFEYNTEYLERDNSGVYKRNFTTHSQRCDKFYKDIFDTSKVFSQCVSDFFEKKN